MNARTTVPLAVSPGNEETGIFGFVLVAVVAVHAFLGKTVSGDLFPAEDAEFGKGFAFCFVEFFAAWNTGRLRCWR